jgi:hypothetical protein
VLLLHVTSLHDVIFFLSLGKHNRIRNQRKCPTSKYSN